MNILSSFWRYWKWLCVALMTTCVVLGLLALVIRYFKSASPDRAVIGQCIDAGGIWDDGEQVCKTAA